MKQRLGFVSNSSSASFVLKLRALKQFQMQAVIDYDEYAQNLLRWNKDVCYGGWTVEISDDKKFINGWTSMDNFDMSTFLEQIGIPSSEYAYERDG